MEAAVGTELFTRDKRHVELTPAGAQLVGVAKSILSQARGYEESVRSLSVGRYLRIFCSQAAEQQMLPANPPLSRRARSQLEASSVPIRPIEYARALLDRADVLLMVRSFEAPGITFFPIAREPWRAVVPATSPLTKRGSVSMRTLATMPLLVPGAHYCRSSPPSPAGTLQAVRCAAGDGRRAAFSPGPLCPRSRWQRQRHLRGIAGTAQFGYC